MFFYLFRNTYRIFLLSITKMHLMCATIIQNFSKITCDLGKLIAVQKKTFIASRAISGKSSMSEAVVTWRDNFLRAHAFELYFGERWLWSYSNWLLLLGDLYQMIKSFQKGPEKNPLFCKTDLREEAISCLFNNIKINLFFSNILRTGL